MNTNKKNTIIIYGDYYDPLKRHNNEVLGALFRKILYYAKYKEICAEEDNNEVVNALFDMIKHYIDIDIKKYQEKCEQNRRNVLKRHYKDIDNIQS